MSAAAVVEEVAVEEGYEGVDSKGAVAAAVHEAAVLSTPEPAAEDAHGTRAPLRSQQDKEEEGDTRALAGKDGGSPRAAIDRPPQTEEAEGAPGDSPAEHYRACGDCRSSNFAICRCTWS